MDIKKAENANVVIFVMVFLFSFFFFLLGCSPTIYWRDSSELQWAAFALGIPHPPGYPAYVILSKAFSFIPFGSLAFRINLVSSAVGALAIAVLECFIKCLIDKLCRNKGEGKWGRIFGLNDISSWSLIPHAVSVSACILMAGLPSFSLFTSVAEAYGPQTLFSAVFLLLCLRWLETEDIRLLFLLFFLAGIGSGIHVSLLFLSLPIFLFLLLTKPRGLWKPVAISGIIFFTILGCSVYLLVPVRASQGPSINWGEPATARRLVYHLTDRKDFGPRETHVQISHSAVQDIKEREGRLRKISKNALKSIGKATRWFAGWNSTFAGMAKKELSNPVLLLSLAGFLVLFIKEPRMLLILFLILMGHNIFFFFAKWGSACGYFPSYQILLVGFSCGAFSIIHLISRGANRIFSGNTGSVARVSLSIALMISAILRSQFSYQERSRYAFPYFFTRALIHEFKPGAIILSAHYWPLIGFLHYVEGLRGDADVFFRNEIYKSQSMHPVKEVHHEDVAIPPRGVNSEEAMRWLISKNIGKSPIYWQSDWDDSRFSEYLQPSGPLFVLDFQPFKADPELISKDFIRKWNELSSYRIPAYSRHEVDETEEFAMPPYRLGTLLKTNKRCDLALELFNLSFEILGGNRGFRWVPYMSSISDQCKKEIESR